MELFASIAWGSAGNIWKSFSDPATASSASLHSRTVAASSDDRGNHDLAGTSAGSRSRASTSQPKSAVWYLRTMRHFGPVSGHDPPSKCPRTARYRPIDFAGNRCGTTGNADLAGTEKKFTRAWGPIEAHWISQYHPSADHSQICRPMIDRHDPDTDARLAILFFVFLMALICSLLL
jgi:hypothetical protein